MVLPTNQAITQSIYVLAKYVSGQEYIGPKVRAAYQMGMELGKQ